MAGEGTVRQSSRCYAVKPVGREGRGLRTVLTGVGENAGMVMARLRYSSSPVVDGHPLLDEPGFWPAHLADLSEGHPPEAFGSDAGDAAAMLDQLHDPSAWPTFTVPLAKRLHGRRALQQRRGVHHHGLLPHASRLEPESRPGQ